MKTVKICYVLSYKSPTYIRTTTLISALKKLPKVELFEAKNTKKGFFRYIQTFLKFIKVRFLKNPDVYIIGFRGHEIYWLLRIFALNKIFVFDEMMSPYNSIVKEKKIISKKSILSKFLFFLEKSILDNADIILTDTNLHAEYFSNFFKIKREKIKSVPVGSDINFIDKKIHPKNFGGKFTVFTYATFLPLHGMDIILETVQLLQKYPINFVIIGGKGKPREINEFRLKIDELNLKNINHLEWLEFNELVEYIMGADICLGGPFGGTHQAKRVVTGKTYQFLSMGKPTIIGKINENFGFVDKKNCLLIDQNDSKKLSESILWGYKNILELKILGENGKKIFLNQFSVNQIKNRLNNILKLKDESSSCL